MTGQRFVIITSVTIARILGAILILAYPLIGLIVTLGLDFIDGRIFAATHVMNRREYTQWDKVLDLIGYCTEYFVILRYGLWLPFLLLFLWRMIGYFIFTVTNREWIFLVCPNVYEAAVLWLFLGAKSEWLWVFILLKFIQEWGLHWFVPHGGNIWWDEKMKKIFPARSIALKYSLSLSDHKDKR